MVVIGLVMLELPLKIAAVPKYDPVEIFTP
jgi:hypothetical protein